MPNWVTNIVTFVGDENRIMELLEKVKNDEYGVGTIDFEKIIPMPENIYRGMLGPEEREKYGKNNWYDWSCDNWGTKWNACGYKYNDAYIQPDRLWFETAWSMPEPVIAELARQFPDIEITHIWADEDFGCNVGCTIFRNGEFCDEMRPRFCSKEAYEMAANVYECTLEELGYIYDETIGNYRWG